MICLWNCNFISFSKLSQPATGKLRIAFQENWENLLSWKVYIITHQGQEILVDENAWKKELHLFSFFVFVDCFRRQPKTLKCLPKIMFFEDLLYLSHCGFCAEVSEGFCAEARWQELKKVHNAMCIFFQIL